MTPGVNLVKDFLTEEEEDYLISLFKLDIAKNTIGGRQRSIIKRYGAKIYDNYIISEMPSWGIKLCNRLYNEEYLPQIPNHITVNTYFKDDYIPKHFDKNECGPIITVISLASEATMKLSNKDDYEEILLPQRSLLQLKEDSRYLWRHEILPVKNTRYSMVFRDSTLK